MINSKYLKYKKKYLQYKYQLGGNQEVFILLTTRENPDIKYYVKQNDEMDVGYLTSFDKLKDNDLLEQWCLSLVDIQNNRIRPSIVQEKCERLFPFFKDHFNELAGKDLQSQLQNEKSVFYKFWRRWNNFFNYIPRNEGNVIDSDETAIRTNFCKKFRSSVELSLKFESKNEKIHITFLKALRGINK